MMRLMKALALLLAVLLPCAALAQETDDFERAIATGLVPETVREEPTPFFTIDVYRGWLVDLVEQHNPEALGWFTERVREGLGPITRGDAVVMTYYAAVCLGADNYNNYDFRHEIAEADGKFWVQTYILPKLCPYAFSDNEVNIDGNTWENEFIAARLWNIWHKSPVSGKQLFAYDEEAGSMRMFDRCTQKEAVAALMRLVDSINVKKYVAIDSEQALTPDPSILTPELMEKTRARAGEMITDLPRLTGFVIQDDGYYTNKSFDTTEKDIQRIASWGFTSARERLAYETLFDETCANVDLTPLKKLDVLVASAIECDIHLNLLFSTLPGRTKWVVNETESGGVFDMFTNKKRQAEAAAMWSMLAERYKDVSGAHLSFTPFWEPEGNLAVDDYNVKHNKKDINRVYFQLVDAIRERDPDRFIFYEVADDNLWKESIDATRAVYERAQKEYTNMLPMYNFCQTEYVFAETNAEGLDIDLQNHSMFKPEYPVINYGVKKTISRSKSMTLDGCLPAGTTLNIYIREVKGENAGSFIVRAGEEELFRERLKPKRYKTSAPLSKRYPFATSDKQITVTLDKTVQSLELTCSSIRVVLSGVEVILPESYAVERWYIYSAYDQTLDGTLNENPESVRLLPTSTILLCPNTEEDGGCQITIHEDVRFSSGTIVGAATAETIEEWGEKISEFSPNCLIRYEDAAFNLGTSQDSMMRYYDDVLAMFKKYGFSWYSNDYEIILTGSPARVHGARTVEYEGYPNFNMELLDVLRKHQ